LQKIWRVKHWRGERGSLSEIPGCVAHERAVKVRSGKIKAQSDRETDCEYLYQRKEKL